MRYLVTSDIHLGNRRTPTRHIANSFEKQILSEENKGLDLIIIAGDLFDRLIESNSKELLICLEVFEKLFTYCYVNKIKLRILEGTPSHDNLQNRIVVKLNELREKKVDLLYFDSLDIEYMSDFNKYLLYIPDEWTHDHDLLEKQIEEKMSSLSIHQVDISIVHTQFAYQVAGFPFKGFTLKEAYFLSITKEQIFIGHFHTHSTFDRINAQGSLERLSHGQEEDKGHMVCIDNTPIFIPNPNAYIYKTLNVNIKTTLNRLDELITKYPKKSYIRIKMNRSHPFNVNFNELKLRYLDYHLEKKLTGEGSEDSSITNILGDRELEMLDSFIINSDIKGTLRELVLANNELNLNETQLLDKHLEVFNGIEITTNTD